MSRSLPPEILDLIVDHIHDEPTALRTQLKTCCLVSKSCVPRTRKHLFAHVAFGSNSRIELWKKAFPDHSNSPARHTRSLSIFNPPVITAANPDMGDLIRTFRNVEHLEFTCVGRAALVPFYGLSPAVRSLHMAFSTTEVFDLVCSFPLLEDLSLDFPDPGGDADGCKVPLTSPKLTGSFTLWSFGRARSVIRQLLDLPGGETAHQEWQDLDRLLVWTSHSVYLRVVYVAGEEGEEFRDKVPILLPELTRRGLIDLVETEHAA